MNTKLNVKTRLTLLVGIVVVLALGGPSVKAQTNTDDSKTTDVSTSTVDSSIKIATKGTVNDPSGAITVSGSVIITCRRVIDTASTTVPPIVLLDLDFSQLKGTTGSGKNVKVYVTGDNHATEIRPLQASDTIIVTTPYFDSTQDILSARSMLVTATLNFDVSTGKLTSGSIAVGNNVVTSSAVGTFTVSQ